MSTSAPEGIHAARVSEWLAANVAGATMPFTFTLITGGRSNLTYEARDGAENRFVVRRPPLVQLLATAHDVAREYRIVKALNGTPVPVPPALAVCDDPAVNGAPFAVTRFVDGVVLDSAEKAAQVSDESKAALAFHLMDVLAELHAVDLDAVGLTDLSRHEGYIERQVKRWTKQWAGSKTRELAAIDEAAAILADRMPPQRGTTIVHGDYRFGNCISLIEDTRIAAVLDWELCTLGDPMADLGHLATYWQEGKPQRQALTNDPSSAGGFPPFDDLLERYARRSGRDVSAIAYYAGFAAWRLAIIGEGVADRHRQRHPEDTASLRASQMAVGALAQSALESLKAAR